MRIPGPLVVAASTAACGAVLMWSPGAGDGGSTALAGSGYARVATDDCNDWNASDAGRRLRLIDEMGDHFGHPSAIWEGAKLPQAEARRAIQRACDDQRASDIKLYKIYSRALTFRAYAEARR